MSKEMKICDKCGAKVPSNAILCGNCGAKITPNASYSLPRVLVVLCLCFVLCLITCLFVYFDNVNQTMNQSDISGKAYETDIPLFINEMPIVSYYFADGMTYDREPRLNGIYINAENMDMYGFDKTELNRDIYLTRNKDKKFGIIDGEIINSKPTDIQRVGKAENKVFLDDIEVKSILIGDKLYIAAAELLKYGVISKHDDTVQHLQFDKRINIDFLEKDLRDCLDKSKDIKIVDNISDRDNNQHYFYIGCYADGLKNGIGMYYWNGNTSDLYSMYSCFERGDFVDDKLYDGISYWKPSSKTDIARIEGARVDGYRREFIISDYKDEKKYRFGYRTVREGTIENGQYISYYREYNENGELIFEGDYADWVGKNQ